MSVVENIRRVLQQKGWDDAKLAEQCKRSRSWMSKRIGPKNQSPAKMKVADLELIATGLGVGVGDLYPSAFHYDLKRMTVLAFFQKLIGDIEKLKTNPDDNTNNSSGVDDVEGGKKGRADPAET